MPKVLVGFAIFLGLPVVLVGTHFLLIEVGREVVTLRTRADGGEWNETRLWVVDYDGDAWLHSTGPAWEQRFAEDPEVELVRGGETRHYLAEPDREPHAAIDQALRRKYGIADRWVRFIAPCDEAVLPFRLRPAITRSAEGAPAPRD